MKTNVILGLFGPGPNPSAALLVNGELVCWVEEERLNRIKTAPNSLPILAAISCLKQVKLSMDDVDAIAFGWDCPRYVRDNPVFQNKLRAKYEDSDLSNSLQEEYLNNIYHPVRIERGLQLGLGSLRKNAELPPIHYYPHHLSHAASAFYMSGFQEANIITIDGSGEEITALLAVGNGESIEIIKTIELPNSLGGFYATMTEYLGFKPYIDEGKVMGLASYGTKDQELLEKFSKIINFDSESGDFHLDPTYRYYGKHSYGARFTDKLVDLLGTVRPKEVSALNDPYKNLAHCTQLITENIVMNMVKFLHSKTGLTKLCLAGGVAMNCVMNGKISGMECVDDIFIQPAAADNGVSLGSALLHSKKVGSLNRKKLEHLYWGPDYSNSEIERALLESKLKFTKSKNIARDAAKLLYDGKIVAWFQGRMEVGARALGGRSILGNPIIKDMKDKINKEVKHRESWRPFCPSIKEESYSKYISSRVESPFMILAFPVLEQIRSEIPSCVHVDGTARPQIVKKQINPLFWNLLDEFGRLSGHEILINTSFNIQGEPVVCTPTDALRTFGGTGIDALAIGDFLVMKNIF